MKISNGGSSSSTQYSKTVESYPLHVELPHNNTMWWDISKKSMLTYISLKTYRIWLVSSDSVWGLNVFE